MRLIQKLGDWFDLRLQLGTPIRETAKHPVPRETASWFYVFGSAALTCFMLQIVTGILLALIYVPSAGEAWNSLQTLNHGISLGWFIRALGCQPHAWRPDHSRSNPFTILRTARFRCPRAADRIRQRAFAHGLETWN